MGAERGDSVYQIHPDYLPPFSRTYLGSNTRPTHLPADVKAGLLQSYHLLPFLFMNPFLSLHFSDTLMEAKLDCNIFLGVWVLNMGQPVDVYFHHTLTETFTV